MEQRRPSRGRKNSGHGRGRSAKNDFAERGKIIATVGIYFSPYDNRRCVNSVTASGANRFAVFENARFENPSIILRMRISNHPYPVALRTRFYENDSKKLLARTQPPVKIIPAVTYTLRYLG